MTRDKFPERVPFRLTRLLVRAMEASGIEGSFRGTAEGVMGLLRENRDSLLAVLEAFVHDPLINWRLLKSTGSAAAAENEAATAAAMSKAEAKVNSADGKNISASGGGVNLSPLVGDENVGRAPEQLNARAVQVWFSFHSKRFIRFCY